MKKIVFNALQFNRNSSGIGVLLRELCTSYFCTTQRDCQIILSHDSPEIRESEKVEQIRIPWKNSQRVRRIFFQSFLLGKRFCRDSVLLATDSKIPFFLPKSCVLVPIITDLAVFRMPEVYKLSRVILWKLQYLYLRKRADFFLAISEFTKNEIKELLHIPENKISVIPCACSNIFARVEDQSIKNRLKSKYNLPEKYVLFVGNLNPRKNLKRLIQAFDLLIERGGYEHHLVIAGDQGWKFDREETLNLIRHRDKIHFIGFVPDEDMAALYSASSLFAFPALYEGFGIPVIEAQSCGTPVLTGNSSSLPEVGGEGALYVDAYNTEDICRGLCEILGNEQLAEHLVKKGYKNVSRFSWKDSAKRLDEVIEEIVK